MAGAPAWKSVPFPRPTATHALQSQEEHNARAGEVHVDVDGYNCDGKYVYSSSNTGESDEESWFVTTLCPALPVLTRSYKLSSGNFYFNCNSTVPVANPFNIRYTFIHVIQGL